MMIGFIPAVNKTFEIEGDFNCPDLCEGKLYYRVDDGRLFYYSKRETRPNPNTGWFPVWDGQNVYISKFANNKYFERDAIKSDIYTMCSAINEYLAEQIRYNQRRKVNDEILNPTISDGDNMFTQCIKGVIKNKHISMIDLVDMGKPVLDERNMENYYSALNKIAFMRLDKWTIWIDIVFKLHYVLEVYKGDKLSLTYYYPEDRMEFGIVKYPVDEKADPFKKIIKLLMFKENINKADLKSDEVDDYTINNMMTTLNGKKPMSAQLFSRFIRMAKLNYIIKLYEADGSEIFVYKE